MNNDKEIVPEKKYVAFHKERQEPVDCFSRHEVDKKLKDQQEVFDKKLDELSDELEESYQEDIKKVKDEFNKILKKINLKFEKYYTQEKTDQFFNVLKSSHDNLERGFEMLEKQYVKLEELVFEYLSKTDVGKRVGDHFIINEKKKKFWKK